MHYISIDIGGTHVRYTKFSSFSDCNIELKKQPFKLSGDPSEETEENICNIVDQYSGELGGIGISLAATMDRLNGKVLVWPNNHTWDHYPLLEHLRSKYNIPIIIEDDANCGTLGEYENIERKGQNFAYITIGTGVGCGLVLNGSLYVGESGRAGELGHIYMGGDNLCTCGRVGCLQSIVSGPAILKKYNSKAKTKLTSLEQVGQLYKQGDIAADVCITEAANHIAHAIYNVAMCLDISRFVIGGGVSRLGDPFISSIEAHANACLHALQRSITVTASSLGEFSGVFGARSILSHYFKGGRFD